MIKSDPTLKGIYSQNMKCCTNLDELEEIVIKCRLCPRLVEFRENAPARQSFKNESYWRKPVPGFGDPRAQLLILGLAPAADGGNRTGRVFTGDPSGVFLMDVLYKAGFANQPHSEYKGDNLRLLNCYITASVKCVPPENRPLPSEFENCSRYLHQEIKLLKNIKAVLTLGAFAFNSYMVFLNKLGQKKIPGLKFFHGLHLEMSGFPHIYASYHPSPQNTYTGKLTKKMLLDLLDKISLKLNS